MKTRKEQKSRFTTNNKKAWLYWRSYCNSVDEDLWSSSTELQ
jgi:hypothetical protein